MGDVGRCPEELAVDVEAGVERGGANTRLVDPGPADERKAGGMAGHGQRTVGGTPLRGRKLRHGSLNGRVERESDGSPPVEVAARRTEVEEAVDGSASADAPTPRVDPHGSEWAAAGLDVRPEPSECAERSEQIGRGGRPVRPRLDQ